MSKPARITRAALAIALLAMSCSPPQPTARAEPLQVLYRLVPQPPNPRDVSAVGRSDSLGKSVPWVCYVVPQIRLDLKTLSEEFGAPDTMIRARHGLPLMLHRPVPGLTIGAVAGAESAYVASTPTTGACWGRVCAFVKSDTVQLVCVVGANAESLVYAPAEKRISRPRSR